MSGFPTDEIRDYEVRHRELARRAGAEGTVLLKNDGRLLPLKEGTKVAVYGPGSVFMIKGGSGSGDVNSRETVSVAEGLAAAGYKICNDAWLASYKKVFEEARIAWRDEIWRKMGEDEGGLNFFAAYSGTPFRYPAGELPEKTEADVCFYVLTRTAGEGIDRVAEPGDYYLTAEEEAQIAAICKNCSKVVLILNTGGVVDLSFLDKYVQIRAVLYCNQPGMEGGNALADVISGKVNPSAKLTDTWALKYEDYPNSATFSHNNGDVYHEKYEEDIFVGYRYFDTFEVPVRYGFGYGLSYTKFKITYENADVAAIPGSKAIRTRLVVTNVGRLPGREVVQLYGSAPQGEMSKEARRLVDFKKTGVIAPGMSEIVCMETPIENFASYNEINSQWMLDTGIYTLFAGGSLADAEPICNFAVMEEIPLVQAKPICPLKEELTVLENDANEVAKRRGHWAKDVKLIGTLAKKDLRCKKVKYDGAYEDTPAEVRELIDRLDTEALIKLCTGDISKAQEVALGAAGITVPGSAAETSDAAASEGVGTLVLADGPAGLRLNKQYEVIDGRIIGMPMTEAMEGGFLSRTKKEITGELRYQYCTAFPVGTNLAQTFDEELIAEFGRAVGEEMEIFDVEVWLAPGMCIHRNPLCGRNFEYYSEDPLVTGRCAAAVTKGTQSVPGRCVTIKHFACNNQEDNRFNSDSIVTERALREIYLKAFEICIKKAAPLAIMTSYNLINDVHAANNYDTCTSAARNEWGFDGFIMTDWTTTTGSERGCTASGCLRAGNDVVMPGNAKDHENIREELAAGTLSVDDLKRSAARLVNVVKRLGK